MLATCASSDLCPRPSLRKQMVEQDAADDGGGSLYPMYFGASCAFLALHLLSGASGPDLEAARRCRLGETLLQGSACLLGLLVWRAQRGGEALAEELGRVGSEVAELKRLRVEDARANEKVVSIFAAHEQGWIAEKKKLRLQIQALLAQFQMLEAKREAAMVQSNRGAEEKGRLLRSKEEALEKEAKRRAELEEQLRAAEAAAEEAREGAKKASQDHAAELWRHKTAFVELVSSQRQLEAELGRALRQGEAARRDLDEALEQKEAAEATAAGLADDLARSCKDAEQKEKILSAMLRKSKLDTAERQVLLKEARLAKARKKQVELEAERLRHLCAPRHMKRLQSHIEGLDGNLSKVGEESVRLEALLVDKKRELRTVKEQLDLHLLHRRMGVMDMGQEVQISSAGESPDVEVERVIQSGGDCDAIDEAKKVQFESQTEKEAVANHDGMMEPELASSAGSTPFSDQFDAEQGGFLGSQEPAEEIEEEKEVNVDLGHTSLEERLPRGGDVVRNRVQVPGPSSVCPSSPWKMNLHALGISYKIKRLKQQLLVLEKLAAAQALKQLPGEDEKRDGSGQKQQLKGFLLVMSLLNKQVKRYQSLEEKTDDLCKRMHEIDRDGRNRGSCQGRSKEQTEALEGFLEETFQLQRYIVATGQKLMDIQSRIACSFIGGSGGDGDSGLKDSPEFNVGKFAAIVRGLFREIQRGLEVRIARIIGNIEGTLASDGFLHEKLGMISHTRPATPEFQLYRGLH